MDELRAALDFLRQTFKLWTLYHWEREAAKALRNGEFYRAEIILDRIRELTNA